MPVWLSLAQIQIEKDNIILQNEQFTKVNTLDSVHGAILNKQLIWLIENALISV